MQTLTYGRKKPEAGDLGSVWFPALQDNVVKDDAHRHDGEDSPFLDATSVRRKTQSISSASWALVANGIYKQTIQMPAIPTASPAANMQFDSYVPSFRFVGGSFAGQNADLKVVKVTAETYDVYINDNTQNLLAFY